MIKDAEEKVEFETTKRLTSEFQKEIAAKLDRANKDAQAIIQPLQETLKAMREKEKQLAQEMREMRKEVQQAEDREAKARDEADKQIALAKEAVDELATVQKELQETHGKLKHSETELNAAYAVIDDNGIILMIMVSITRRHWN